MLLICKFLLLTVLGSASGAAIPSTQEAPTAPTDVAQPKNAASASRNKDAKQQKKKARQELAYSYKPWLDEVALIMTDDERKAFAQLSTNEEREQYIEIFWRNRNPNPESATNEFQEEYYRRLAYADEHFASGVAGRKTDRGRVYILWGPPAEIESHPTGGTYDRPMQEGGGSTSTYPWERWRYRHLEGVGENIEVEFVDPTGTGEYRMTMDPCEKDALAHVPGAGSSMAEALGQSTRAGRFTNTNGTTCAVPFGGMSTAKNEFDNLEIFSGVQRGPKPFKDLEEKVSAHIVANQLPFQYRTNFLRATSNTALVPITVQLRNRDLSFAGKDGVQSAALDIYGRITDPGGRVIQTFEDTVKRDVPEALFASAQELASIYQKSVPLRSGLYRLDLVVRDVRSGNIGTLGTALRVPRFAEDQMDASSLILADQIELVAAKQIGTGQFVMGAYKVRPRMGLEFSAADKLGIYLQLYNLQVDEVSRQTKVSVGYRITKKWRGSLAGSGDAGAPASERRTTHD